MKKIVYSVICTVLASVLLTGCTDREIKEASDIAEKLAEEAQDQTRNITDSQDSHVLGVKNGYPFDYPDQTYGEAFEDFFSYPAWKYFVGTKEGADEDGDGKPDYEEENVDIVEFTGYCTYSDTEVKALIQFTLDKDTDTFEATYLSFNDVPQNMLMLYELLDTVFSDGETKIDTETNVNTEADAQTQGDSGDTELLDDSAVDIGRDLSYPIMSQGYTDGYSPCPVMVNAEDSGVTKSGAYEEMLASLINDGTTMYASPIMCGKEIYTATKWDAPQTEWYDALLTYDQFLAVIGWMQAVHEETGADDMYTSGTLEDGNMLSGRWSDGNQELSISMYSDGYNYFAFTEIGNVEIGSKRELLYFLGKEGSNVYICCLMENGEELIFRYKADGTLQVWSASDGCEVEAGTQFQCVERYVS